LRSWDIVQAGRGCVLFYGQEPIGNIEASDTEDRLETELRIIFGGLLFQGACWSEDTKSVEQLGIHPSSPSSS
jgi:hypothetical protein